MLRNLYIKLFGLYLFYIKINLLAFFVCFVIILYLSIVLEENKIAVN